VATILAIGFALCAALYWTFLNTPESNVATLTASALLIIAIVAAAGLTVNTTVLVARGTALRAALVGALRGLGWFVVASVPLVFAWAAIARVDAWTTAHQGEINAWFITQFGWADVSWLFRVETWASRWLRFAVLPAFALSLLAALLTHEGARRMVWPRRAAHWRTVVIVTAVFVLLWALPWQLTGWRPQLPPTWLEPAAAAARLAVVFLLLVAGAAGVILVAVGGRFEHD
jgi:hypothetical protein